MAFNLFEKVPDQIKKDNKARLKKDDGSVLPKAIRTFMGELGMLQHIPLYYLIPDEKYLPQTINDKNGVLKIFRLDKEWIECLMDGALSLGGDEAERKLLLAKSMAGNYVAEVYYNDTKAQIIKQIKGAYSPEDFKSQLKERLKRKHVSLNEKNQAIPTAAQNNWNYTGFVMRSDIISAWVGVEVIAKGDDPKVNDGKLQVIRLERLANDTLFCLCEGMIKEVEIIQPPEAFHFDIIGKDYDERNPAGVPGVIDIKKLKNNLGLEVVDAAHFAKKMSSRPLKVVINVDWNNEG